DTFRMTAVEQLEEWAKTANVHFHRGSPNQDPASVAYQGCKRWRDENFDHVIIDTAGRLHTQANLINELAKIRRVVAKNVSEEKICSWLTLDSMLGQSSFAQAKLFGEALPLDGLLLTKFDGTGKAGTVFAIASQLKLPIPFITHGEEIDAIKQFDAKQYVHDLLYE
ncbi:signal recognition particle-docking protein FtsY, partial [Candidatus Babeliales bacterium]|nr:signal recognition particle-docking protein FtsY [Candidatus Babeliales bacterium]